MVHDDGRVGLDGMRVEFDDTRAVADAGIMQGELAFAPPGNPGAAPLWTPPV
jgi:hypothetical protein